MPLRSIAFNDINEATLQQLIANGVSEGREIDYKRDQIGGSDDHKKEFLKDVSAFANAVGGHLVIGMDEAGGIATNLPGLAGLDADKEILRLESMTRDGIEPRLIGVMIKAVPLTAGGCALVIRVPRSWNPPHRVCFKGWNKFFTRNSAGTHEVNVEELRALFTMSASLAEKVREWRIERISRLLADDTPVPLEQSGQLVLHLLPLANFQNESAIDVAAAKAAHACFYPAYSQAFSSRINFDGLLLTSPGLEQRRFRAYTQLFRDGCIETALGSLVREHAERHYRTLPWGILDKGIFEALPRFIEGLAKLGVSPPYVAMISLLGIKGSAIQRDTYDFDLVEADRDVLSAPPITIDEEKLEGDWQGVMRPAFDAIWNAYGHAATWIFDAEGRWLKKP